MSSEILYRSDAHAPVDGGRRPTTSSRAQALADRLEQGTRALAAFAIALTDKQWNTCVERDGRKVGVVVHHVASVLPLEIELARIVAGGQAVEGLVMHDVHAMNAVHAEVNDAVTKGDTLDLLRWNSAAAAAAIRSMTDAELDLAAPVSLYGDAPLTAQFLLEDHAVRHSYHHLARLRAALRD